MKDSHYLAGWRDGYAAAERDMAGRIPPDQADALVAERVGALLAMLRAHEAASALDADLRAGNGHVG